MSGWYGFDLDGTIARYEGYKHGHIGEPIKPMVDKIKEFLAAGKDVRIFTARIADGKQSTVQLIEEWCLKHIGQVLKITNVKTTSMIALYDDRAIAVEKNTGKILGGVEPEIN